ncbi:MAG TPA: amidohydrolase [Anaerovoracaceae bacterium]|nr:amidohydrolase [Anaerovoracaceae bacterium]
MEIDLILKNGNIVTMDPALEKCNWVAVKGGKITGRGIGAPPDTDAGLVIDLKGKTVLPGLADCHVHTLVAGLNLNAVPLQHAKNIGEVLALMRRACREADSEWVFGANYVPQNVQEGRYPDRWELDSASDGKKVMIMAATLHGCAVNSEGMKVSDVPEDMPGVEKKNGCPSGIFSSDESSFLATANVLGSLPDGILWGFIGDCCANAVSKGVTTMHGLFGQFVKGDRDVDLILKNKDKLPLEMAVFYQTWDVKQALDLGLPRVGGCLTLDGALFEYTMANFEPYSSAPALRGVLYHNDDEVYQVVSKAHAADLQCSMHAVGERAIDQLIYTYRRVIMEQGRKDLRHRIEHFCLPTDGQIAMAKDLGLILSMQPGFTYLWDRAKGGEFEFCLGRARADRWDPFHRIIGAGCIVCGGSDCPVTPVEPLVDIASCVHGHNPIRNIPVDDAIRMYTVNAAYAAGLEKSKGSIEVGKDADFVAVNMDPYEHFDQDDIYDLAAEMTIKAGTVVYQR